MATTVNHSGGLLCLLCSLMW